MWMTVQCATVPDKKERKERKERKDRKKERKKTTKERKNDADEGKRIGKRHIRMQERLDTLQG